MGLGLVEGWIRDVDLLLLGEASGESPNADYPRDLTSVAMRCDVMFEEIPHLTASAAREFARKLGMARAPLLCANRTLRGCIIAERGEAIIFTDPGDPRDEQRFTLAHELAHYALDYVMPRQRALQRLGEPVLSVLNGERDPTPAERIDAALEGVPLGGYMWLMERGAQGRIEGARVAASELRADAVALHLLAPLDAVMRRLPRPTYPETAQTDFLADAVPVLCAAFGLPERIAADYARRALWPRVRRADTHAWLGL